MPPGTGLRGPARSLPEADGPRCDGRHARAAGAAGDLPDEFVWRGCASLGTFAHSYVRVLPQPPGALPESIERPWAELCRRLHRPATVLTYDDLICYNWRPRDISRPERRDLEDLELLTPTVGTQEERIFYSGAGRDHVAGRADGRRHSPGPGGRRTS